MRRPETTAPTPPSANRSRFRDWSLKKKIGVVTSYVLGVSLAVGGSFNALAKNGWAPAVHAWATVSPFHDEATDLDGKPYLISHKETRDLQHEQQDSQPQAPDDNEAIAPPLPTEMGIMPERPAVEILPDTMRLDDYALRIEHIGGVSPDAVVGRGGDVEISYNSDVVTQVCYGDGECNLTTDSIRGAVFYAHADPQKKIAGNAIIDKLPNTGYITVGGQEYTLVRRIELEKGDYKLGDILNSRKPNESAIITCDKDGPRANGSARRNKVFIIAPKETVTDETTLDYVRNWNLGITSVVSNAQNFQMQDNDNSGYAVYTAYQTSSGDQVKIFEDNQIISINGGSMTQYDTYRIVQVDYTDEGGVPVSMNATLRFIANDTDGKQGIGPGDNPDEQSWEVTVSIDRGDDQEVTLLPVNPNFSVALETLLGKIQG